MTEHSTDDDGTVRSTDGGFEAVATGATRRTFLTAAVAAGGFATGVGAVGAQSSTGDGPPAPTSVDAGALLGHTGTTLDWDWPGDPCGGGLSHFLVDRGERTLARVPAGVTRARLSADAVAEGSVGVTAVGPDWARSETVSVEARAAVADPQAAATVDTRRDVVGVGESVDAAVELGPLGLDVPAVDGFEVTVDVSTPCAAAITDLAVPDGVTHDSFTVNDGIDSDELTSLTVAGTVAAYDGDAPSLLELVLTGRNPAATELHVRDATLESVDGETYDVADVWSVLEVDAAGPNSPSPPSNVRVEQGVSASVDVFWDVPADPCESVLSHYAVSVDGTEEKTVPVGVSGTNVDVEAGEHTVGVRALSATGVASPTATRTVTIGHSDPLVTAGLDLERGSIGVGETVPATLVLNPIFADLPDPVSYDLEVAVTSPCAARITGASSPEGAAETVSPTFDEDGGGVSLSTDALPNPSPAREPLELATIEVTGRAPGATGFDLTVDSFSGDAPAGELHLWNTLTVTGSDSLPPVGAAVTNDLDGDGLHEDLNGNGRFDSDDVVTYFTHLDDPAMTEHPDAYDVNGNSRVDFDDVVQLFNTL